MEEQCSPLGLAYYYQEEGFVEELKHSLLYSTLELEAAVISAHEEILRKDDEIIRLKDLIEKIVKERDEFEGKCGHLVLEKDLLLQQISNLTHSSDQHLLECPSSSNTTSNQESNVNTELSASDSDDNINNNAITASPSCNDLLPILSPEQLRQSVPGVTDRISIKKPLPEKGKFLQAIMEAGPLLQTLLLAGPLPQWQHPPPQLNSGDIPPVKIFSPPTKILLQDSCLKSELTNKRVMINMEGQDFSPNSKHQKVCSPSIIDPTP